MAPSAASTASYPSTVDATPVRHRKQARQPALASPAIKARPRAGGRFPLSLTAAAAVVAVLVVAYVVWALFPEPLYCDEAALHACVECPPHATCEAGAVVGCELGWVLRPRLVWFLPRCAEDVSVTRRARHSAQWVRRTAETRLGEAECGRIGVEAAAVTLAELQAHAGDALAFNRAQQLIGEGVDLVDGVFRAHRASLPLGCLAGRALWAHLRLALAGGVAVFGLARLALRMRRSSQYATAVDELYDDALEFLHDAKRGQGGAATPHVAVQTLRAELLSTGKRRGSSMVRPSLAFLPSPSPAHSLYSVQIRLV